MSEDPAQQPPAAGWNYKPDTSAPQGNMASAASQIAPSDEQPEITWTASEYIAHNKDMSWYLLVGVGGALLAAIVYLLTRDRISTGMVVIVTILFAVAAARKPRVITYTINHDGIYIGQRFHPFVEYRSFTVHREGVFANIELLPFKRFMPMTSIYCSPDNEDDILDVLSQYVPYEAPRHSIVDSFARRIRF